MGALLRIFSLILLSFACQADVGTFLVDWKDGSPVLPPMVADGGGTQLVFTNAVNELEGGYLVISQVGKDTAQVLVLVNSTKATLTAIGKMTQVLDVTTTAVEAKDGAPVVAEEICAVCDQKISCAEAFKKIVRLSSIGTSAEIKVEAVKEVVKP